MNYNKNIKYNVSDLTEIKKETKKLVVKKENIPLIVETLNSWNECILNGTKPEPRIENLELGDFTISYDEFKIAFDYGMLTNQHYLKLKKEYLEKNTEEKEREEEEGEEGEEEEDKEEEEKEKEENVVKKDPLIIMESKLDLLLPSMSKDGLFNMMTYEFAKHQKLSNEVEFHYITPREDTTNLNKCEESCKEKIELIRSKSYNDKKVHFITVDLSNNGIQAGHVTPIIVTKGNIFEFDSVGHGLYFRKGEYSVESMQQTDETSCRPILIDEFDDFMKVLENFSLENPNSSISEELNNYLKQFFSENKKEYFVDSNNPDLLEPVEGLEKAQKEMNLLASMGYLDQATELFFKKRRLALLPFIILKHSQSLSSLTKILEFLQKIKSVMENHPENIDLEKYTHLIIMTDKLKNHIERYTIQKRAFDKKTNELKFININYFDIKTRLKQVKALSIMCKNGLIKKLEDIEEYKHNGNDNTKANIATVNKEWIDLSNKSDENLKLLEEKLNKNDITLYDIEDLFCDFETFVNIEKLEEKSKKKLFNIIAESGDANTIDIIMDKYRLNKSNLLELISLAVEKENYELMNDLIGRDDKDIIYDLVYLAIENKNTKLAETLIKKEIINENQFIQVEDNSISEKEGENNLYKILINKKYEEGNTLLHIAIMNKDKELMSKLFDKEINVDIKNDKNQTPLDIAKSINDSEILSLVEEGIKKVKFKKTFEMKKSLSNDFNKKLEKTTEIYK